MFVGDGDPAEEVVRNIFLENLLQRGDVFHSYVGDCTADMHKDDDPRVVISGWMCTVCHRTPPHGEKLSICKACRVDFLGRYCSKACQERDWEFHKKLCKNAGKHGELERRQRSEQIVEKAKDFTSDWLYDEFGYSNLVHHGWKHRALSPVILHGDPNYPHGEYVSYYLLPRVFWDSQGFGSAKLRDTLRRIFADPDFDSDKMMILVSVHAVAKVIITTLPLQQAFVKTHEIYCCATDSDDKTCSVLHALRQREKEESMAETMVIFCKDPLRYRRIVHSYMMGKANLDHGVQLSGLRNATYLNGRVGRFLIARQSEEKRFQGRHVITLDDGKNVGVPFLNIEYIETLTFSDKLDDLARKILDDPALPVPERDPRVVARSPEYESDWLPDGCSAEARST